jgi:heme o synthase
MSVYLQLIRPGLLAAVLFSTAVAALAVGPPAWPRLICALLGLGLMIAGASAVNQIMEREQDARMARTASRPLPSGRMSVRRAAAFAAAASLLGIGCLFASQPPAVAILAAFGWGVYVLLYTPLKRTSVWQVPVGALAGATPCLVGAAINGAAFAPLALALFGIVFFWQFTHTAAIGWIYRDQYADSRIQVAAVADPSGRLAGWLAVFGAVGAASASLVPAVLSSPDFPYIAAILSLGTIQTVVAAVFLKRPTDRNARLLWHTSLAYLPLLLLLVLAASRG